MILPDPASAPWVREYIEELCAVPAAEHWDQADATAQALDRLMQHAKKPLQIWGFRFDEGRHWTPWPSL